MMQEHQARRGVATKYAMYMGASVLGLVAFRGFKDIFGVGNAIADSAKRTRAMVFGGAAPLPAAKAAAPPAMGRMRLARPITGMVSDNPLAAMAGAAVSLNDIGTHAVK